MLLNQIIIQDNTIYVVNQKYIYGYISREENLQYKERVVCSLQKWTTSWPILRYHSSVKERKGQSFVFAIYLNVSTNSLAILYFNERFHESPNIYNHSFSLVLNYVRTTYPIKGNYDNPTSVQQQFGLSW